MTDDSLIPIDVLGRTIGYAADWDSFGELKVFCKFQSNYLPNGDMVLVDYERGTIVYQDKDGKVIQTIKLFPALFGIPEKKYA